MLEFRREPRRLVLAIAGAVALVATGYLAPTLMLGGPGVDDTATGATATVARAGLTASIPPTLEVAAIPAPPENLLVLEVPEPAPAPAVVRETGSPAFLGALEVLLAGEYERAFELANAITDSAERRTIQWAAIQDGKGAIGYESVIRFAADAPDLAKGAVFRTRLEQALLSADAAGPEIIRHLGGAMPNTVDAQIALARAYVADGQAARAARIARDIWLRYQLTPDEENRVHRRLGALLTAEDHWDRAVNLMMHDRATGVERLLVFMTEAQKSLVVARNAVSRNKKDAKKLLDAVDPTMRDHPVYIFSRAQRARQFELWDDAVDWLNKVEGEPPEAAEWWYERRTVARRLVALGKYELAFKAADGYRKGPEGRLVEAHFHAGWIALSFLDDPANAARHFEEMTKHATLPDTVTQSNYWLGRARRALGDAEGAMDAFAAATRFGTVYYGLLAREELGAAGPTLREMPEIADGEAAFEAMDAVRSVRLLAADGERARALTLLRGFAQDLDDGGHLLLAAHLAEGLDAHDLAISIAETAERKGFPLDLVSFPDNGVPTTRVAEVDPAAIFAVARQESRFRTDAVSSAGARGLMQLMPGTAKETAAKVGLEYSKARLTSDPEYNALLGSTYLAAQLEAFDRSLVLAAAAYNAGPGNARKWIAGFGDPRSDNVDPVVWVEQIPFEETRKYVQRVLGNYLVYRARLGHEDLTMREALRRIPG
jgi:soluble lytic murein transglycosylase